MLLGLGHYGLAGVDGTCRRVRAERQPSSALLQNVDNRPMSRALGAMSSLKTLT
jgi:hypothetical protein